MRELLFIGTYTEPILFGTGQVLASKGRGIHILELDRMGRFHELEVVGGVRNPSFLCLAADKKHLYAVNELKEWDGRAGGAVSAFAFEYRAECPTLRLLNARPTGGGDPCHAAIDDGGSHVFVSNFMSGSVSVFPVLADGSLGEASDFIQYEGSSVDPRRQKSPHAHSLVFDKAQRRAFVPDLGTDKVMCYDIDFETGTLVPAPTPFMSVAPGDGPRFMEFHPNGKWAYLIHELASGVSLLHYREDQGTFVRRQVVSTLPDSFTGDNICADLHLTPDGGFLYASNRGNDSIACYRVNAANGELRLQFIAPCGGKTPRNFCISASGELLLVANQDSDNLVSYRISRSDGSLEKIDEMAIGTPVCVRTAVF